MTFVICVVVLGMAAVPQHTYSVSLTPSTPHRCLAPRLGSKVARKAAAAFEGLAAKRADDQVLARYVVAARQYATTPPPDGWLGGLNSES